MFGIVIHYLSFILMVNPPNEEITRVITLHGNTPIDVRLKIGINSTQEKILPIDLVVKEETFTTMAQSGLKFFKFSQNENASPSVLARIRAGGLNPDENEKIKFAYGVYREVKQTRN